MELRLVRRAGGTRMPASADLTSHVSRITMDRLWRKGRQAHRNVLRSFSRRRTILNPFTSAGNDSLACVHLDHASLVLHAQLTPEHDSIFVKFGRLARFDPAARAAHVSDACGLIAGVYPANVFVNQFGFISRRSDARWLRNQFWHARAWLKRKPQANIFFSRAGGAWPFRAAATHGFYQRPEALRAPGHSTSLRPGKAALRLV